MRYQFRHLRHKKSVLIGFTSDTIDSRQPLGFISPVSMVLLHAQHTQNVVRQHSDYDGPICPPSINRCPILHNQTPLEGNPAHAKCSAGNLGS